MSRTLGESDNRHQELQQALRLLQLEDEDVAMAVALAASLKVIVPACDSQCEAFQLGPDDCLVGRVCSANEAVVIKPWQTSSHVVIVVVALRCQQITCTSSANQLLRFADVAMLSSKDPEPRWMMVTYALFMISFLELCLTPLRHLELTVFVPCSVAFDGIKCF